MSAFHKRQIQFRSISWLLVSAILLIALLPVHYHPHHIDSVDSAIHDHVIDLHLTTVTDSAEQSHHDLEMTSFSASPDSVLKKNNSHLFLFVLMTMVLIVFPVLNQRISHWLSYRPINRIPHLSHFTPLLRAPPH